MTSTCKHCEQAIISDNGACWAHTTPSGHVGKMRCNPSDSGLPYGYNAETHGQECGTLCLGSPR